MYCGCKMNWAAASLMQLVFNANSELHCLFGLSVTIVTTLWLKQPTCFCRDDIKLMVNIQSPIPTSFYTTVVTPSAKKMQGWSLYIYLHFCIVPTLLVYFFALHCLHTFWCAIPTSFYISIFLYTLSLSIYIIICGFSSMYLYKWRKKTLRYLYVSVDIAIVLLPLKKTTVVWLKHLV